MSPRTIRNAILFASAFIVGGAIAVLLWPRPAKAATNPVGLTFRISSLDTKRGTCAAPVDTASTNAQRRWEAYRTAPNSFIPLDTLGTGWGTPGSVLSPDFGAQLKSVPSGTWSFAVAIFDSAGNSCPVDSVTAPRFFDGVGPSRRGLALTVR